MLNSTKEAKRARRPHADDAREQPRRTSRKPSPATSSRWRPEGNHHRRHAVRSGPKPVISKPWTFPEPVIEIAVEPKTKADQEKMGSRCKLAAEDPSFRVDRPRVGPDHHEGHGRTSPRHQGRHPAPRVQGRGEHRRAAGGLPRNARREAEIDYTHKKQTGGTGQFARVKLTFEPTSRAGFVFENEDRRRCGAEGIHPGRRKGHQVGHGLGSAGRLPGHRLQGRR
jgi:elongation factor G